MKAETITLGILAHVDAGKTTLSEALLFKSGAIRKLGRVDHQDAFLDNDELERKRGITIYSKEARLSMGGRDFVLLDTPGHADFGAQMERTLSVMDYAVLVVSGPDGVQSHTQTLARLLEYYKIPFFVFVNKMDQPAPSHEEILRNLGRLGGEFVEFGRTDKMETTDGLEENVNNVEDRLLEALAGASEEMMEEYLETGTLSLDSVRRAIENREVFLVVFGSALKGDGVGRLMKVISEFAVGMETGEEFSAKVYKIDRDKQGNRLTHVRVTGGSLKNKMNITDGDRVEQIRLYNGENFVSVGSVGAGQVCALLGPAGTYAGQVLGEGAGDSGGNDDAVPSPILRPALSYAIILPAGADSSTALSKLRVLEEEEPTLSVSWDEENKEIKVAVMGDLALDILKHEVKSRFDMDIEFGEGTVVYKETIARPVIGVGHYEPLRHYAEVQLLLSPLPAGSGLVFDSMLSEDVLSRNWQRLIMQHLSEKAHRGVLVGGQITDMRVSLVAGRAHPKHTEGGDFRQATYRALRCGLRMAESVLLEPVGAFRLRLPAEAAGRALTDLSLLGAAATIEEITAATPSPSRASSAAAPLAATGGQTPGNLASGQTASTDSASGTALITGTGPIATLKDYSKEVRAYTKGSGTFTLTPCGYAPCHNAEEIIEKACYDPDSDMDNPTGSVFCEHGAGVYVDWQDVPPMAHTEPVVKVQDGKVITKAAPDNGEAVATRGTRAGSNITAGKDELEAIFLRTYGKSKRDEAIKRANQAAKTREKSAAPSKSGTQIAPAAHESAERPLLLIDGYNVIFAWEELAELSKRNFDSAREALIELVQNYAGYRNIDVTIVFDGYKLPGNAGTNITYGNLGPDAPRLSVVYTKEAKTADRYIEETTYTMGRKRSITVVTSDRPVQMAALGDGASRMSARELIADIKQTEIDINAILSQLGPRTHNRPFEILNEKDD